MLFKIQWNGIKPVYLWSTGGDQYVKETFQEIHPRLTGWRWVRGRPFNSWEGGWFWKKISCKRLTEENNCMQHKCNRKPMGKKGKNIPPTRLLEKKNSWWPEITHPSPQEVNGRPLNISYDVNRRFPNFFDSIFGWLGPDPTQLVLCTLRVSFPADFIASWKTVH